MKPGNYTPFIRSLTLLVGALLSIQFATAQAAAPSKYPNFPSETPAKLEPATDSFDYDRRDV